MRWNLPSTDVSIPVEFVSEGQPIIPDASSVRLTVRDSAGTPLAGFDSLAIAGPYLTQRVLVVGAANNTLGSGETTKTRFVQVDYLVGGIPLQVNTWYGIRNFVPLTVEPQDVRAILGLRDRELPDGDIDLFGAYLKLVQLSPDFAAFLVRTDGVEIQANKAVSIRAALDVLPSVPARALKEETLSNAGQIRASIDWAAMGAALQEELDLLIGDLLPDLVVLGAANIFVVVTPVDPVTNA